MSSYPADMLIIEELKKYIPKKWATSTGGRLEVPRNMKEVMRAPTKWDHVKQKSPFLHDAE